MIQTSNFSIAFAHPNAVAIARMVPRNFKGRRYPLLAPPFWLLQRARSGELTDDQWQAEYRRVVLEPLDPRQVVEELGPEAVLLCYEPAGEACHRRLVATWLETALGITVPER